MPLWKCPFDKHFCAVHYQLISLFVRTFYFKYFFFMFVSFFILIQLLLPSSWRSRFVHYKSKLVLKMYQNVCEFKSSNKSTLFSRKILSINLIYCVRDDIASQLKKVRIECEKIIWCIVNSVGASKKTVKSGSMLI